MAYPLGRKIGLERRGWMRRPKVRKAFGWARYELEKSGVVLLPRPWTRTQTFASFCEISMPAHRGWIASMADHPSQPVQKESRSMRSGEDG